MTEEQAASSKQQAETITVQDQQEKCNRADYLCPVASKQQNPVTSIISVNPSDGKIQRADELCPTKASYQKL